eukprot:12417462-Karenia_brevis.AAC.1
MAKVGSKLGWGQVEAKLGQVAAKLGQVAAKLGQVATKLGQVGHKMLGERHPQQFLFIRQFKKYQNCNSIIRITPLGGSRLQDEAKMASNSEVWGHLASKLGGLDAIFA